MFEASSAKQWDKIQSEYQDVFQQKLEESNVSVQLRLQGIDALETHYSAMPIPPPAELRGKSFEKAEKLSPGHFRQPAAYGDAAVNDLLDLFGVESISWKSGFGRRWINEVVVKQGSRRFTYGTKNEDRLEGYVVVNDFDRSGKGLSLEGLSQLTDEDLLFPYLFRRLVKHQFQRQMEGYWDAVANKKSYTADPEELFLDTFFDDTNPYIFLIDERDFVRLDSIVQVTKTSLKMKAHPGNVVFLS